jgi:enoyl-CoA hydratase/carnithine racemase
MDTQATTEDLLYEVRDGIGYITFNRPQTRNAMTFAMYARLQEICAEITETNADGVKVLVITGAGEKAFAAGTDISQFRAFKTAQDALDYEARGDKVQTTIERCPIPIIAAIAGACTGGGFGIAACCDIRISTADARFGFPISRTLGNCLSMANYARLYALLGPAKVKDIIFTARLMNADEALASGLVSEVLPDAAAVHARAEELARTIAGHAPLTIRASKEALRRVGQQLRPSEDDKDLIVMCYTSEDFREGMEAFLNKRKPVWRGV